MSDRQVQVVVVAYHAADELERSLQRVGSRYPVTVVDNSLSDAVRHVVRQLGADYVDSGRNRGFAGGVNLALRSIMEVGHPVDVLLLNPDAQIDEQGIADLERFLHSEGCDRVAAVSPTLRDSQGRPQRVAWPFPSPARGVLEAAGLGRVGSRSGFVIGAVLLLRWEALNQVGLFDERFFLYAEEADWQRRASALGWCSEVYPEVTALHLGAATSSDADRRDQLFHAAHETYMRKWFGWQGWLMYRIAVLAGSLFRAVVLRGPRRRQAWRRAHLYVRGPRHVAGLN
jgi:GT2 family glycosyltransferase